MINEIPESGAHIGYACSYVPGEVILAAGMAPWRLLPESVSSDADSYLHSATCCHIKGILSEALRGDCRRLGGIILANSCDGMRRLADILQSCAGNIPVFFLDIPKQKNDEAVSHFAFSLRRLIEDMADAYPASHVTTERLNDAIRECNTVRRLMSEIFAIQKDPDRYIECAALLDLCKEAGRKDPGFVARTLTAFMENMTPVPSSRAMPRVVLTGNVFHRSETIAYIEKAGVRIAVLDSCIGERHFKTPVQEETADPVAALASRYLKKAPCARMEGMAARIEHLETLVDETAADGIICFVPKYCDTLLYELPVQKENARVPFLAVEHEPGGLSAQSVTRIDAFLEMLKGGK